MSTVVDPTIPGSWASSARRHPTISDSMIADADRCPTETAELRPIAEVARDLGIAPEHLEPYGRDKAKVRLEALDAAGRAARAS